MFFFRCWPWFVATVGKKLGIGSRFPACNCYIRSSEKRTLLALYHVFSVELKRPHRQMNIVAVSAVKTRCFFFLLYMRSAGVPVTFCDLRIAVHVFLAAFVPFR